MARRIFRRNKRTPTVGQVGTEIVVGGRRLWVLSIEVSHGTDGMTATVTCADEHVIRRRYRP